MLRPLLAVAARVARTRPNIQWRHSSSYERKTPVEHILLRPGMYIGQTEPMSTETWLYDSIAGVMTKRQTTFNPALLKVFDEILVNAADNKHRDAKMSAIEIIVTRKADTGRLVVSIENDGRTLPIEQHETEKMYIPELVFGHLLTGSNFNDSESRLTGGSHGYGAKLTNIFSTSFTVEAQDGKAKLNYHQEWQNNMSELSTPVVTKSKDNRTYTKVTFEPDLTRFGGLSNGITGKKAISNCIELFQRRALDVAACIAPVQVRFSVVDDAAEDATGSHSIPPISSFAEYVQLFKAHSQQASGGTMEGEILSSEGEFDASGEVASVSSTTETVDGNNSTGKNTVVHCKVNPRWEVAVCESRTGSFESMSFVNSVWTQRGGTHVNMVTAQLVKAIESALNKKGVDGTAGIIKNKLMVFVNCKVENPSFDGQTKDALNTKAAAFGSTCKLPDKFLKEVIAQTGVLDSIMEEIAFKDSRALRSNKTGRKQQIIDVPKLEDAHAAGGDRALECTLILTEGDSAKALAVSGLEVVGRELFGVMPLRGKVLNVRGAPRSQVHQNAEFLNLCKALGLDFANKYENGLQNQGLRYGRVMIMCDQDTDGSHIKGLVINLFQHFWPALLRHEGFLQQFITPLVKARAKSGSKDSQSFFSIPEFKQWQDSKLTSSEGDESASSKDNKDNKVAPEDKYSIKYYKGLGTNTAAEGREYFSALQKHRKDFEPLDATGADAIDMAFNKERASHRRDWLAQTHDRQAFLDPHMQTVTYSDFINKELIHYSFADNHRSIPSAIDGLKPSQRKVLYGCFKKKLTKEEIKVVQLAGYIAEHTAYHHDEGSLNTTIINMAQDFVGSNNVPLLVASGQFGTRAVGGKDFASPRYVFTRLSPITRLLFPEEDDGLLQYEQEDGQAVEPRYFVPVLPTLLLNGSQGIGTGWSTSVPTHHLPDVVEHVRCRILGTTPRAPLQPYVVGFTGNIAPATADPNPTKFTTSGIIHRTGRTHAVITELPSEVWTDDYKRYLMSMVESGAIRSFKELHTTQSVRFEVTAFPAQLDALEAKGGGLAASFHLVSSISLSNMHAFDRHGKIRKYSSADEIVDEHHEVRGELYQLRKASLERKHAAEELRSRNRSRFIGDILSGEIEVLQRPGAAKATTESGIIDKLRARGFADENQISRVLDGDGSSALTVSGHGGFGYLLDMPIYSLTQEKSLQLQTRAQEAGERLQAERHRTVQDMWLADLDRVSSAYDNSLTKSE